MRTSGPRALAIAFLVLVVAAGGLASACSGGPPKGCGDDIGGTADEALFGQHFSSMSLVSQVTGQPGQDSDNGAEFDKADILTIQADAKAEVAVRACVQFRSGGGDVPFDQTRTLAQGPGSLDLGTFEPGSYVVRVIVGGTLVKNFPFQTK
jgi:hypothetical protein